MLVRANSGPVLYDFGHHPPLMKRLSTRLMTRKGCLTLARMPAVLARLMNLAPRDEADAPAARGEPHDSAQK
ncbi:hypothetical protein OKW43_004023 [Paraburkholderia sp. WC7.3g]|uniref:Uncharacterized protein n=1 Tax=Paraburkholderia podalyriae TaxID=1938811 RepID=A0ABR7PHA4_9BURK|nr:hypothetical protein [Paraburkholderia podalyriae]MBC8745759.1 hypothetical protein [Paraburkholderia podalyriae]